MPSHVVNRGATSVNQALRGNSALSQRGRAAAARQGSTQGGRGVDELSHLEIDLSRIEANVKAIRGALRPGDSVQGAGHGRRESGAPRESSGLNGRANAAAAASSRAGPRICAVVKKNAYGLGAVSVSHRLVKAGVDMLAVYDAAEAAELVSAAVKAPILVLMPVRDLERTSVLYRHASAGRLHLSVHDPAQLDQLNRVGRTFGLKLQVQFYLDTGMSRSGLSTEQFLTLMGELDRHTHIQLTGIYTHPATADVDLDFLDQQVGRFQQALDQLDGPLPDAVTLHAANTSMTLRGHAYHLDMVRPGLGMLGFGPSWLEGDRRLEPMPRLAPAVRWMSRVTHVQRYEANAPVGYGCTCRLNRPSVLGVVPVGYGDGYPLALSGKAKVRITPPMSGSDPTKGDLDLATADSDCDHAGAEPPTPPHPPSPPTPPRPCSVLGQVNMDQLVIDLTDLARESGIEPQALLDAEAEIYANDPQAPNDVSHIARQGQTHPYEILCRLNPRLPRRYVS